MSKTVVKARQSYVRYVEPNEMNGKYGASFIFSKDDKETLAKLKAALTEAIKEGEASVWHGKRPDKMKLCLRDGDKEKNDAAYKNAVFLNANTNNEPVVLNSMKQEMNPSDAYSGEYCYVSLTFYPYSNRGSNGIACGLNAVMCLGYGDRLDGKSSASSVINDFADIPATPVKHQDPLSGLASAALTLRSTFMNPAQPQDPLSGLTESPAAPEPQKGSIEQDLEVGEIVSDDLPF